MLQPRCTPICRGRRSRRGGYTLLYVGLCIFVLLGIVSFGIDLGRMQTAKTELQRAVDASARYGAYGLSEGTAVSKALAAGADAKNNVNAYYHTDSGSVVEGMGTVGAAPSRS